MKSILLLSCLIPLVAAASKCNSCFIGVCYQRTKLFDGFQISGQLAADRTQNSVYFHYANKQDKDYTGTYKLNDGIYSEIPGISYTFARAVDQASQNVYMSGTRGIYKYVPSTNTTVLHGLADKTIWQMQYTDKLYYTVFSVAGLNTFENGRSAAISALASYKIDDFVVDKLGDIYFFSDTAMYRLKKSSHKAERFGVEPYSLATDRNGNVYFTQSGTCGVYKLDYSSDRIVDVGAFGGGTPLKFVFDSNNNVVYHDADDDVLYYLLPTYGRCMVSSSRTKVERLRVIAIDDVGNDASSP